MTQKQDQYAVLPELTGVETPIAVLTSIHFRRAA